LVKLTNKDNGVTFAARVQPRASRSEINGEIDGALKVRLAAPPVDGEANVELIRFLAKLLAVQRSQIEIISGHTSKNKVVRVNQVSIEYCQQIFAETS
jgi:uncharacterized protein (TIGR00251 family)